MAGKETESADRLMVTLSVGELRAIVREEVKAALPNGGSEPVKDWLKAEELSKQYGLPKTWFEDRGRAGEIERVKPGRYVLFKRRDVEAYLEKHRRVEGKA